LVSLEPLAQRLLEGLYPPDSWTDRVVRLLGGMLVAGSRPSLDAVARELAVSPRSLQKSLKTEGASYQRLLDRVRQEIAIDSLGDPDLSLCDVAFLLGFAEQSAFNHAFKRWTGSSPRQYREKTRA
jgi:AraC-like DNA-binding protein